MKMRLSLAVITLTVAAAPMPASAGGVFGDVLRATGIPAVQKLGNELDNGARDVKQAAPVVAAAVTMAAVPIVGTVIAAKEHPKETMALGLIAASAAVACSDGCTLGISGLAMIGGTAVAVPLVSSDGSKPTQAPIRPAPSPAGASDVRPAKASDVPGALSVGNEKRPPASNSPDRRPMKAGPRDMPPKNAILVNNGARYRLDGEKQPRPPKPRPFDRGLVLISSSKPPTESSERAGPYLTVHVPFQDDRLDTIEKQGSVGPNLGDPWLKITPQASISGAAGPLSMVSWNAHPGQVALSDFTISPGIPILPFTRVEATINASGVKGVALVVQDPTGAVGAASIGTDFIGVPNLVIQTRLFNLTGGVAVVPDTGAYNAVGQLERAVYELYGQCPEPSVCLVRKP